MSEKPTVCEHCGASLTGAQWSLVHGLDGAQPFTQCPTCHRLIYLPADPPKPAA